MNQPKTKEKKLAHQTYEKVLSDARAYCAKHCDGGNLHVVLEDGNVEDFCLESSLRRAIEANDGEGADLANALLAMSVEQRLRLVNAR